MNMISLIFSPLHSLEDILIGFGQQAYEASEADTEDFMVCLRMIDGSPSIKEGISVTIDLMDKPGTATSKLIVMVGTMNGMSSLIIR